MYIYLELHQLCVVRLPSKYVYIGSTATALAHFNCGLKCALHVNSEFGHLFSHGTKKHQHQLIPMAQLCLMQLDTQVLNKLSSCCFGSDTCALPYFFSLFREIETEVCSIIFAVFCTPIETLFQMSQQYIL